MTLLRTSRLARTTHVAEGDDRAWIPSDSRVGTPASPPYEFSSDSTRGRLSAYIAFGLGLAIASTAALHAALALRSPSPWIVPDELIYADLARSLGGGHLPSIRGVVSWDYGIAYPLILAPIWTVSDGATAYDLAKVLNAIVLSLAALPAFYLARRFTTPGKALVIASLAISVPSMLYASTIMTEVVLYPIFILALLAMCTALHRPTPGYQLAALGAILIACTVKVLAVVLLFSYVTSIALMYLLETRSRSLWWSYMKLYALTWSVLFLVAIGASLAAIVLDQRPGTILGAYVVVIGNVDLASVPWWALLHVAEFSLFVAVIPLAATLIVLARGLMPGAGYSERLFTALFLPVALTLFIVVAAFASTPTPGGDALPENVLRLHERSTFVIAPMTFIGLVIWLQRRRTRAHVTAAVAVGVALLPMLIPSAMVNGNARFQALALVPWVEYTNMQLWPLGAVIFTLAIAGMFIFTHRVGGSLPLLVLPICISFVVVMASAYASRSAASAWVRSVSWADNPTWIDSAAGSERSVSVLWAEPPGQEFVPLQKRHLVVFVGEILNRRIHDVYEIGSPMPYLLPTTRVELNAQGVVVADGAAVDMDELVLVPCYIQIEGRPVAYDDSSGAAVVRIKKPVRAQVLDDRTCPVRSGPDERYLVRDPVPR